MRNGLLLGLTLAIAITGCGPTAGKPPVANAGSDQTVKVGATVLLDGTHSKDPQNLPLQFHWKLTAPDGSKAALDDATLARPAFVADQAGTFSVLLVVDDGAHDSPPT